MTPRKRQPQNACDCGNSKPQSAKACARCTRIEALGIEPTRNVMCGVKPKVDDFNALKIGRACDKWLAKRGLPPETHSLLEPEY